MIKTYANMQAEVLKYGFTAGTESEERIGGFLNEGLKYIANATTAPDFQESATVALTKETFKYTLPTEFLSMLSVVSKNSGRRLHPVGLQEFDSQGREIEGIPYLYAIWKTELLVFPTPGETDTLEVRYMKRPVLMSAAGDEPVLGLEYRYLLVRYALIRMYEAEDDLEAAGAHEKKFRTELAGYQSMEQNRQDDYPRQLHGTWGP